MKRCVNVGLPLFYLRITLFVFCYKGDTRLYTVGVLAIFYLGRPGGLFLCGDLAQSVVEGIDFRFEEVRSIGHFVVGKAVNRNLIPQKPLVVNVNYRSHSGILDTAGSVLQFLSNHFPSAAKQLKKDYALFNGSRPGCCHKVGVDLLSTLLSGKLQGTVLLTHDESASHWRRALKYQLVYGIREAKGLEFRSVIILDFFAELPSTEQKPWRNLLLHRTDLTFEQDHPLVESQLKLLCSCNPMH